MPHALLVEDDDRVIQPLTQITREHGFSSRCARTLEQARHYLTERSTDVLLLGTSLPDGLGLDLLDDARDGQLGEVIVMSDGNDARALDDLRAQVRDCLTKPLDLTRIQTHLEIISRDVQANGHARERAPNGHARHNGDAAADGEAALPDSEPASAACGPMLGNSEPMRELYRMLARVAPTDATVLLVGESGTGKELIAQTVHERSTRRSRPMIPINCGAIPENLIESELFGHEKGSFTGASQARRGVFERASGGTLLLDEITEMPAELQVRLLRVLETGRIVRVGGEKEIEVDVRVIAATNQPPDEAVTDGRLREDLLYRLSVFPVHVPPLRERHDDVELLAHHFLATFNQQAGTRKRFHPGALSQLRRYAWPGNVRQLRNIIWRAHIMADDVVDMASLPAVISAASSSDERQQVCVPLGTSLADAERELIYATLAHCQGDKRRSAKTLGVSLKTLYNRLNSYKVEGFENG
ncbi:MAG: sigma-54 dependent transcriptional regulator [Phycisphaeraceae bacterium]